MIGATELKVSTDRVTIEELAVELVTGLSMSLSLEKEIPSMLVARIDRHTKLRQKYQVGIDSFIPVCAVHFTSMTDLFN